MAVNHNGKVFGTANARSTMEDYDNLHPLLREISRNAVLHVNDRQLASAVKEFTLEQIKGHLEYGYRESCLLEYGPDHPQAK